MRRARRARRSTKAKVKRQKVNRELNTFYFCLADQREADGEVQGKSKKEKVKRAGRHFFLLPFYFFLPDEGEQDADITCG
jgi:hypothetical protein